jgi:hypothetical protein
LAVDWKTINLLEQNEMEYAKRRRLIDLELAKEDFEPAITDSQYEGETAEEFYRNSWLKEMRENGR